MGKPAIVLAMVIAPEGDLAAGKAAAPVVVSVKFINAALLQTIGSHLQLSGLHAADDPGKRPERGVLAACSGVRHAPSPFAPLTRPLPARWER